MWQLWIAIPIGMVMVWQLCNMRLSSRALDERSEMLANRIAVKYEWRVSTVEDIDPLLGLHMIIVALKSGVAIPRALQAVGDALPGGKGMWMCNVSHALIAGDAWREAWSPPYSPLTSNRKPGASVTLASWLQSTLHEAWCLGSSPVPVLIALSQHYEQTMANVARKETSRLSVRLLLPVGLCFLPAFICIGIVPTVASMMH